MAPFDNTTDFVLPRVDAPIDDVLRVLIEGRARIASPENWVQRRVRSEPLPGQYAYCALGAICHASIDLKLSELFNIARAALSHALPADFQPAGNARVAAYNNTRSHAEVIAVFDRAIAARRAELGQ